MSGKMNIAFIVSMKYGLTQFMFRDIAALKEKGHNVQLYSLITRPGLYNPLPDWDVVASNRPRILAHLLWLAVGRPVLFLRLLAIAIRTGSLVDLAMASYFAAQMRDTDVIYAYFGDHKLFTGYYCKLITDIPLVVTIRAYELYRNPNPKMFREALGACDRVVTITQHNERQLVEKYGVSADAIDVVRQIVDLDTFKFRPRIKILVVGFFAEKKGHDVLFKAVKSLNRDDIELWVVGEATPTVVQVDCRQLADELGVASQVAFFGAQQGVALRALYRDCDIFCLPSRKDRYGDCEGFPNVIAEAMAFGKPVISTRHAGIPEAIDALLVDENNVEQLARAISQACDDEQLRRRVGKRNRIAAEELFSEANNGTLADILRRFSLRYHQGLDDDPEPDRPASRHRDVLESEAADFAEAAGDV